MIQREGSCHKMFALMKTGVGFFLPSILNQIDGLTRGAIMQRRTEE
jgi:hypothetical protein